jgi:hypothetical protein
MEPLITFGFSKQDRGKCDSMHSSTKMGLTKMIEINTLELKQITGDIMHLIGDKTTQKLDSLKVLENTLFSQRYTWNRINQVKGQNLYGKFLEEENYTMSILLKTQKSFTTCVMKHRIDRINKK